MRWTFRYADKPGGHLEFNVECVPRRSLGIDRDTLAKASNEADLRGGARVDGERLIFSLAVGHESKAHELCEGGMLDDRSASEE